MLCIDLHGDYMLVDKMTLFTCGVSLYCTLMCELADGNIVSSSLIEAFSEPFNPLNLLTHDNCCFLSLPVPLESHGSRRPVKSVCHAKTSCGLT